VHAVFSGHVIKADVKYVDRDFVILFFGGTGV
jgi:hypothetical protein